MDILDLIALAEKVQVAGAAADETIENIERYVKAFEEWRSKHSQMLTGDSQKQDIELLSKLNKVHVGVLTTGKNLQQETSEDLRALKKKGAGIMAYLDRLPENIILEQRKKKGSGL